MIIDRTLDTIPVSEWGFFDESIPPIVIAGPCSAESELQVMMTAKGLHDFGIHVFRAGIWKPRTHPGSFEGAGVPGLKWLQKVKKEYGMNFLKFSGQDKQDDRQDDRLDMQNIC